MRIKHLPEVCGIYKLTNLITGEVYIGSSFNIYNRVKNHKQLLQRGQHGNRKLTRGVVKYGLINFKASIIKSLNCRDLIKLRRLENYYIEKYNSFEDGYNEDLALVPKAKKKKTLTGSSLKLSISVKKAKNDLEWRKAHGKEYKLIDPKGQVITIKNLSLFAETNGFSVTSLRRTANGGRNYRGYKAYKKINK